MGTSLWVTEMSIDGIHKLVRNLVFHQNCQLLAIPTLVNVIKEMLARQTSIRNVIYLLPILNLQRFMLSSIYYNCKEIEDQSLVPLNPI